MSIADHFEHAPDAGFIRTYDTGSARRQFSVSLMLIVVIAIAASALGFLVNFDSPTTGRSMATATTPAYVGSLSR
jgi:Tfp pilus assembly protein PilN